MVLTAACNRRATLPPPSSVFDVLALWQKDVTQAVDGAVKRKSKPAGGDGLGEAVREKLNG